MADPQANPPAAAPTAAPKPAGAPPPRPPAKPAPPATAPATYSFDVQSRAVVRRSATKKVGLTVGLLGLVWLVAVLLLKPDWWIAVLLLAVIPLLVVPMLPFLLDTRGVTLFQMLNLNLFAWLEERFKFRHYAQAFRWMFYRINMQFPISHTERYKLRIIWYWYPLYTLGSMALFAFVVATITGIILGLYYVPSRAPATCAGIAATEAWKSIGCDIYNIPFGFIMRQLHFWSAMVMVAAVFLHMLRVFFTQAYKKPRELNWLIGVGLLVFTLGLGYTGYLLPWSQLSYWAGTIGLKMALATPPPELGQWVAGLVFGGQTLGQATITRMYILHVFILPIVTYLLIGLHIFIVWIQGIAEPH